MTKTVTNLRTVCHKVTLLGLMLCAGLADSHFDAASRTHSPSTYRSCGLRLLLDSRSLKVQTGVRKHALLFTNSRLISSSSPYTCSDAGSATCADCYSCSTGRATVLTTEDGVCVPIGS